MSLSGKRALVVGLLNKHSLAASVTQALLRHGASCVVASRNPMTESQVRSCGFEMAPRSSAVIGREQTLHMATCDVESDESINALLEECGNVFDGELDILVHSVAFAPKETFQPKGTLHATRAAWQQAMDISAYSLIALSHAAHPLLEKAASRSDTLVDRSIIALSFAGANKVVPSYNVMGPAKAALEATARQLAYELGGDGIRVNCVSPGPMNTVSARGIPGISKMRKYSEEHAPLQRNASARDVGELTAFLASDAAAAITGQTLYVDGGLSSMAPYARDTS